MRVGGEEAVQTHVRVIAATNRDLPSRIAEGRFREDLYYRLNVVALEMPPLRQRRKDIALLADQIVRRLAVKYGWPHLTLDPEAVPQLIGRPWPGNVRELQNVLSRAAILVRGGVIGLADLQAPAGSTTTPPAAAAGSLVLRDILAETERRVIRQALEQEKWNRTRAAQVLGVSRRQLFEKIRQYGLQK